MIDMVANHSSDQHPWFQEALRAGADDPARHRYVFRPGRGDSGELPPNNWVCAFGSSAWTRTAAADGTPGDWYLHTFSPEQPDLNWVSPLVQDDMLEVLRFWYGRGIDGMRIDAVPAMWKADGLPDAGYDPADGFDSRGWTDSPHWDHPGIHDVLRRWRAAADDVGLSRARAMALVQFGLPGSPCVYQGDELGLPEVLDLPDWALATDPVFGRSDGASRGRAGCRVPLPWDAAEPAFGFSDAAPWLPQPTEWATASIAAQTGDPASTLELLPLRPRAAPRSRPGRVRGLRVERRRRGGAPVRPRRRRGGGQHGGGPRRDRRGRGAHLQRAAGVGCAAPGRRGLAGLPRRRRPRLGPPGGGPVGAGAGAVRLNSR